VPDAAGDGVHDFPVGAFGRRWCLRRC
jgi:hypothetical protein